MVNVDLSGARCFFDPAGPDYAAAAEAHRMLFGRSDGGSNTGWLDLPQLMLDRELKSVLAAAERIKRQSQLLLVVGIGGAHLGARAAIELLQTPSHNYISGETQVYFLGNDLSPDAVNELIVLLGDRDFSVNYVSRSGCTPESALGFRVAKTLLERKYGRSGARRRITVTTDITVSPLAETAKNEGWELFAVPPDICGRFDILSPAGLLPMAVAGIDIKTVLECASEEMRALANGSPENPAWQYAAARQHLYRRGKSIELMVCYEPAFRCFAQWWRQLFAGSEGKNSIGIFPAFAQYNGDIYSMGQYVQDGPRILMETVVSFEKSRTEYRVPFQMGDYDGLNHLAGRELSRIMETVSSAVKAAHIAGGAPNMGISIPCRDEAGFAALVCFFQVACAISACMMGVDPFNQPAVDEYKKNIFNLLKAEK